MIDAPSVLDAVRDAYSAAACEPESKHPFPVGRRFAESVGYPVELLDELPAVSVEAFAGVSNVALFAEIPAGSMVLDLGCGAGLDTLIASQRTGPEGKVHGVDFSTAMIERALRATAEARARNVELVQAEAGSLPLPGGSIDVALVNGIFNLNPDRGEIFRELARVVRRDGAVYAAELILNEPLPAEEQACSSSWFA